MGKELLSIKELSQRWNCTEQSLRKQMREGQLKYCELPGAGIRFRLSYIIRLEGGEEDISIMEQRRLKRENDELKRKLKEVNEALVNILTVASKSINN